MQILGARACRDIVGAFNFLLKTLVVDTPTFNEVQLITIYKKKRIGKLCWMINGSGLIG